MVNNEDKTKSKKDLFGDSAKNRNMGTRRLNRMPLLILILIGGVFMAAICYTYYTKVNSGLNSQDSDDKKPAPSNATNLLAGAPLAGLIDANKISINDAPIQPVKPKLEPVKVPPVTERLQKQLDDLINQNKPPEPKIITLQPPLPPAPPALTEEEKQAIALARARQAALNAAIQSATTIGGQKGGMQAGAIVPAKLGVNPYSNNVPGAVGAGSTNQGNESDKDPNKQQEKKDFLNQKVDQNSDTLPDSRIQPLSPYEVKAGTIIPSVMISGINSDIPGQIIGQVSENIFDTAKGQYILIPQGSRIIGSFDSSVSLGQERILVVWRRIIYPDASSIDLEVMSGADQAGYSGFHDQVNNHYLRTFGSAILLSVFSAAGQLSQPNTNNNNSNSSNSTTNSAQQTAAAALGQQLTQLGTQMIQKNMDIAPTLTIRPGYKFIIMVNKDIQLKPWNR